MQAWVSEAQRLRLLPFLERAELLKAMSFDDLNLFRSRQVRPGCGRVGALVGAVRVVS